ncbi:hypothetical protein BDZ91DRAFT_843559 [Kalaharituber pfeilii]|nr:hypothetical protein BDZ91DRAFT_843559 [Kalaharituber pfeilii]
MGHNSKSMDKELEGGGGETESDTIKWAGILDMALTYTMKDKYFNRNGEKVIQQMLANKDDEKGSKDDYCHRTVEDQLRQQCPTFFILDSFMGERFRKVFGGGRGALEGVFLKSYKARVTISVSHKSILNSIAVQVQAQTQLQPQVPCSSKAVIVMPVARALWRKANLKVGLPGNLKIPFEGPPFYTKNAKTVIKSGLKDEEILRSTEKADSKKAESDKDTEDEIVDSRQRRAKGKSPGGIDFDSITSLIFENVQIKLRGIRSICYNIKLE